MSFIVVGIDGSPTAHKALLAAVEQAKFAEAELRVVSVVVASAMSGYEFGPLDLGAMKAAAEKNVTAALDQLDAEYGGKLPVPISSRVLTGHVGAELLRVATEGEGAAMVIAGSRGLGGFRSLLVGSVTTYLTHHLEGPLLIIPPDETDE